MYAPGRETLLDNWTVLEALQEVADKGMTDEAKEYARAALLSLKPPTDGDSHCEDENENEPRHIMLSYQCEQCLTCCAVPVCGATD